MNHFISSRLFAETIKGPSGIALALDEGLASTTDVYSVFYGERLPWWVDVTVKGTAGHASRFIEPTAVGPLVDFCQKALDFRKEQRALLDMDMKHEGCSHAVARKHVLGDVTTLNITRLQAGVRVGPNQDLVYNVVPPIAECSMDIRISPHFPPSSMRDLLDTWCRECSINEGDDDDTNDNSGMGQVTWKYAHGNEQMRHTVTPTDPVQNPWYAVFSKAFADMNCKIDPQVFPAATDSRFLRLLGIRALGFSPMKNTEILLHEDNEYIPIDVYLEGIDVYIRLIQALGDAMPEEKAA
jgi:aminoacylase